MGKIASFLLGGVIGAGVALALTPYDGEKTRSLVLEKANSLAGDAKGLSSNLPDSAQDIYKTVREKGEAFLSEAQTKVKEVAGQASDSNSDELREKIEAARQRIAAQVMENAEKAKEAADDVAEAKHAAQ